MTERPEGSTQNVDASLAGIEGALLFPAIGLIVAPIWRGYDFITGLMAYPAVAAAGYGRVYAINLCVVGGLLALMIYTATRFFAKRHNTRMAMIVLLCANFSGYFLLALYDDRYGGRPLLDLMIKQTVQSIGPAVIWVPYFLFSKRVRATFVN